MILNDIAHKNKIQCFPQLTSLKWEKDLITDISRLDIASAIKSQIPNVCYIPFIIYVYCLYLTDK